MRDVTPHPADRRPDAEARGRDRPARLAARARRRLPLRRVRDAGRRCAARVRARDADAVDLRHGVVRRAPRRLGAGHGRTSSRTSGSATASRRTRGATCGSTRATRPGTSSSTPRSVASWPRRPRGPGPGSRTLRGAHEGQLRGRGHVPLRCGAPWRGPRAARSASSSARTSTSAARSAPVRPAPGDRRRRVLRAALRERRCGASTDALLRLAAGSGLDARTSSAPLAVADGGAARSRPTWTAAVALRACAPRADRCTTDADRHARGGGHVADLVPAVAAPADADGGRS